MGNVPIRSLPVIGTNNLRPQQIHMDLAVPDRLEVFAGKEKPVLLGRGLPRLIAKIENERQESDVVLCPGPDIISSIPGLEARNLLDPLEIGIAVEQIEVIIDGRLSDQEIDGTSDGRSFEAQLE